MVQPTGRREASKQATRTALRAAASRLFAERGFDETTVRDIASAAGVTERTFYRYFDGKEDLLSQEFEAWLGVLRSAIAGRPAAEPPLGAVQHAMIALFRRAAGTEPPPVWVFSDRPLADLRRTGPRPLLRLEAAIADAVRRRADPVPDRHLADPDADYQALVISRVAVAVLRSAIIRRREERAAGAGATQPVDELIEQAFAMLG